MSDSHTSVQGAAAHRHRSLLARQPQLPPATGVRLALVNMPFSSAKRPSIQLGLLGPIARAAGAHCDCHHFNLDLAAELGPTLYETLCEQRGQMTGDWLFSVAAFAEDTRCTSAFFESFPDEAAWVSNAGSDLARVATLREQELPAYVQRCADAVDWSQYDLIGFSSTFQQNVASLALARAIKRQHPGVCILFGGANVEGEMGRELLRAFSWVDLVVSGEADVALPELLSAVARKLPVASVRGVLQRQSDGQISGESAAPVHELDALPTPDYTTYFERVAALQLLEHVGPALALPIETSRGCWWGAKHHCTFCGLNGSGMAYRQKSPSKVTRELRELSSRHAVTSFEAVDNIMSTEYLATVFREIEEQHLDYRFFYEVKANLTRSKLRQLARGGVTRIQPGIESLSTHVLELMRKGCTMLQNVLCLKWCRYYDIRVSWNLLHGFPGETPRDYLEQQRVLEAITHLEPPISCGRIWLERFSPFFSEGEALGITARQPSRSYGFVYPKDVELGRLAYFFDYAARDTVPDSALEATRRHVERWNAAWTSARRPRLSYRRSAGALFVDYDRGEGQAGTYPLSGPIAEIYEFCSETMRTPSAICAHMQQRDGRRYEDDEVRAALELFCERGLMLDEDDKYLSLAIPENRYL